MLIPWQLRTNKSAVPGVLGNLAGVSDSSHLSLPFLAVSDNPLASLCGTMSVLGVDPMVTHLMQEYSEHCNWGQVLLGIEVNLPGVEVHAVVLLVGSYH